MRMALLGVVGQTGCLTLVIVLVALGAGLWLDNQFHTRPLFTLALVLGSIPLTLALMFRIVLSLATRIRTGPHPSAQPTPEEGQASGQS